MKFLNILFLLICVSGFAQSKVGTIDIDYIVAKMPETPQVQKEIEQYSKSLETDLDKLMQEYNVLIEDYKAKEASFTPAEKANKQLAITTKEEDISKFQQNGNKLVSFKKSELLKPVFNKIGTVLEKLAKENSYTQILQIDNQLVYMDENYDLTLAVMKELGLKIEE